MGCIDEMNYEILLPNSSFRECADFIKKKFREIHYVPAGFRIFGNYLIGVFVLRISGKEEAVRLRAGRF